MAPEQGGTSTDQPFEWGASREMNGFETVMWRAEADPQLRSPILAIELLDTAPDRDRFLETYEWGSRMAPRLRRRVVEPPLGLTTPRWVNDPEFDLTYHVRHMRLPSGGGWRELLTTAEQFTMTPFDRERPPWEVMLVEGLPGGTAAHLLKLHHSVTDGLGGIQLFAGLHSRTRKPSKDKPQPPAEPAETVSSLDVLTQQVASDLAGVPGAVRELSGTAWQALTHPRDSVTRALRYGDSLRRVLAPPDAAGSPLLRNRSLALRFDALDVGFADLRAAAKAAGGSLNDAYLAALLGGYRRYHEELGHPVEAIPMGIPVSVRGSGDAQGENRIASIRLSGPVGLADPAARIQRIRATITAGRSEPALDSIGLVSPALARLPGSVIAQLAGSATKGNDLQASNVPGIGDDVFLAGARVERMYGYPPRPGAAAMITMATHGDTCCVGISFDPAAVTEPELFGRCLEQGFAEVLALAPDTQPPVRRTV